MEIYERMNNWKWRFGETPKFQNSFEKKFDWAMVDIQFNVEKGVIIAGQCFTDCLVPNYIDGVNEIINSGSITYDEAGMKNLGDQLKEKYENDENQLLGTKYTEDLV